MNLIGAVLLRVINRKSPFKSTRGRPSPTTTTTSDSLASAGDVFESVLKKSCSKYLSLNTRYLSFVDCTEFLGPGTSLRKFIKCFGDGSEEKLFFPYDILKSPETLNVKGFPTYDDFHSSLTDQNLLEEGRDRAHGLKNYRLMEQIYEENHCQDLGDYLTLYNIADVSPFYNAVSKLIYMYQQFDINMIDHATLPAIANYLALKSARGMFYNNTEETRCWESELKQQIFGGFSSRLQQFQGTIGETLIMEKEFGALAELIRAQQGWDFNALYSREVCKNRTLHP